MTDKTPPEALSAPRSAVQAADGPTDRQDGHGGSEAARSGPLRQQIAAAIRNTAARYPDDIADAVLTAILPTTRLLGALHQSAHDDVTRVIDLYERWVKAGPPPIGVLINRWWDARLVELHNAILPPRHDDGPGVDECTAADRKWPLEKAGE